MKCSCEFLPVNPKVPQFTLGKIREYNRWKDMVRRCYNPKHSSFHHYGGRGIMICRRWLESFQDYLKDVGKIREGMSLDRRNNDSHYCPHNVRWATKKVQNGNRRRRGTKNPSGRGVSKVKYGFQASISVEGRSYYICHSKSAKKVAREYRRVHLEWFGYSPP